MIQSNITLVVATLTLLSNIFFVFFIILLYTKKEFRDFIYTFVNKYIIGILFFTSSTALVGSLIYSNIAGFPPCELCWIQRIFMFPQPILLFTALLKRDKSIVSYILPLTVLGTIVSFYHSLTNWGIGTSLVECASVGGECSKLYVFEYGYITIPFMAFSTFAYLLLISVIYYKSTNERI